jgi:hypothetical protein
LARFHLRQIKAYQDVCTLHRPQGFSVGVLKVLEGAPSSHEVAFKEVRCSFVVKKHENAFSSLGHSCQQVSEWRFSADQEIDEGWILELSTPQHPLFGSRWCVCEPPFVRTGRGGRVREKVVRGIRATGMYGVSA